MISYWPAKDDLIALWRVTRCIYAVWRRLEVKFREAMIVWLEHRVINNWHDVYSSYGINKLFIATFNGLNDATQWYGVGAIFLPRLGYSYEKYVQWMHCEYMQE